MTEEIEVWIVEDEKPAARLLESMVKDLRPAWNVRVIGGSVASVISTLDCTPSPALLFLDVQLSDGDAFSLLRQVELDSWIIFTTAYDQYAVEAFGTNSLDYLLKPVVPRRLLGAIEKFERTYGSPKENLSSMWENLKLFMEKQETIMGTSVEPVYRKRFLVEEGGGSYVLKVEDICLIQTAGKYSMVTHRNGKEYVVDYSLDRLVTQLDPELFFRISRQYIVNIFDIVSVEPYFNGRAVVHLKQKTAEKLVVSRDRLPAFRRWIDR